MKYHPYINYKDSDVEWLGDIPNKWEVLRFSKVFTENKIKNKGLIEKNVLSLSYGSIKKKNIETNKGLLPESFETYQIVEPNDIIFRFTDLQNDKKSLRNGISKYHGIITSAYLNVKTNENADYYNYLFRSYDLQKVFYSMGDGMRQSLKIGELNLMPILLPSFDEQTKIVEFIQNETNSIDKLILKQKQLIQLLAEQRKSVISDAVTKGLNPNAPMKDSSIKWLGKIPEYWGLKRLGFTAEIVRGNSSFSKGDLLETGDYVALQYGKTYKVDQIDESFSFYVNHDFFKESQIAQNGDVILVSTSETLKDLGHSCFYARYDTGLVGGEQFLLKPNREKILGKYLYYTTKVFSQSLQIYATGTKVFRFNSQVLKTVYIPYISLEEQQKIIDYLDYKCSKIDLLVSKQKNLIEKLKEYRSSIISHAVTGKIDVREAL